MKLLMRIIKNLKTEMAVLVREFGKKVGHLKELLLGRRQKEWVEEEVG